MSTKKKVTILNKSDLPTRTLFVVGCQTLRATTNERLYFTNFGGDILQEGSTLPKLETYVKYIQI